MSKKKKNPATVTAVHRNQTEDQTEMTSADDISMSKLFGQVCEQIYKKNKAGGCYGFTLNEVVMYVSRYETSDCVILSQFYRSQIERDGVRDCLAAMLVALRKEGEE